MPHQLGQPGEQEMGLDPIDAPKRPAQIPLDQLESLALLAGLFNGQDGHGEIVSVPSVLLDRNRRQPPAHGLVSLK